jgi:hypothetical protein
MHACSKINQAKDNDPKLSDLLNELTKQITQAQTS